MQLMSLPLDVVVSVIEELVSTYNLVAGLHLRLVNRLFDREILRAYFMTELVDFHAADVIDQAKRMSKVHAARLLHGKLLALDRYGPRAPWLYGLNEAVQILHGETRNHFAGDSTTEADGRMDRHRSTAQKLCDAVTEYLGVLEILHSLNPKRQKFCCKEHYVSLLVDELHKCRVPPETLGRLRRNESALDWAILTADHLADHVKVRSLVEQHRQEFTPGMSLAASLQCAARRGNEVVVRLLLDAGADINGLAHAGYGFVEQTLAFEDGSALEAASAAGHYELVKLLLCESYGLEMSGEVYENAICMAARIEEYETSTSMVRLLMSRITSWVHLGSTSEFVFRAACSNGNVELATLIFEYAPVNLTEFMHWDDSYIFIAVKNNQVNMVSYILSQYHARAGSLGDPLLELSRATRLAVRRGQLQAFSLLWEAPQMQLINRWLFEAVHHGQVGIIQFLVGKGLDLSSQYFCPHTSTSTSCEKALISAVEYGQVSVTEYLLELGVRTHRLRPWSRYTSHVGYPAREHPARCKTVEALLLAYGLGPVPQTSVPDNAEGVQNLDSRSGSCSSQH